MSMPTIAVVQLVRILSILFCCSLARMPVAEGWSLPEPLSRREALGWIAGSTVSSAARILLAPLVANALADDDKMPDRFDVDNFIKTGMVAQPMGVSGQAGKSRPETGVILRDGSDVNRDARTGDVLAEILLSSKNNPSEKVPVLASFQSPWPLATGTVFDVECRDTNTGDGAFLAVTTDTKGVTLQELSDSFFINQLIAPTSRFSFYGSPTDVKVRKSGSDPSIDANYRLIDLSFSTLSQSTQTEIPRRACVIATIPEGTSQAVMLVGSTSALRWKKGADQDMAKVIRSFRAIPAPKTSLKVRAKERRTG